MTILRSFWRDTAAETYLPWLVRQPTPPQAVWQGTRALGPNPGVVRRARCRLAGARLPHRVHGRHVGPLDLVQQRKDQRHAATRRVGSSAERPTQEPGRYPAGAAELNEGRFLLASDHNGNVVLTGVEGARIRDLQLLCFGDVTMGAGRARPNKPRRERVACLIPSRLRAVSQAVRYAVSTRNAKLFSIASAVSTSPSKSSTAAV